MASVAWALIMITPCTKMWSGYVSVGYKEPMK